MSDTTDRRMGLREACERAWVRGAVILFAAIVMAGLIGSLSYIPVALLLLLLPPSLQDLLAVPLWLLLASFTVPLALGSTSELRGRGNGSFFES